MQGVRAFLGTGHGQNACGMQPCAACDLALVSGRSAAMSLVQSAMRVLTSAGQSSGTLGSCSRPRFTGVVRVTICSGRIPAST